MNLSKLSLFASVVAVPVSLVLALQTQGIGAIGVLILAPVVVAVLSGALAVASLVRRDKPRWLSIVALVVAVAPAVALAGAVFYKRLADDQYQNRSGASSTLDPAAMQAALPAGRAES